MKTRKIIISLLLILVCAFAFSACGTGVRLVTAISGNGVIKNGATTRVLTRSEVVVKNQTLQLVAVPNAGNYFVRWEENGAVISTSATYEFIVTRNYNLTAVFSQSDYTVSYSGGTTVFNSITMHYGDSFSEKLPTPTYNTSTHKFLGWYKGTTLITQTSTFNFEENITLTAKIEPKFQVVFMQGNDEVARSTAYYCVTEALTYVPTAEVLSLTNDQRFFGWYSGTLKYELNSIIQTQNLVLTAYIVSGQLVSFEVDGEAIDSVSVTTGQVIPSFPSSDLVEKEGSRFIGWFYNGVEYKEDTIYNINGDITLTATYSLEYDLIFKTLGNVTVKTVEGFINGDTITSSDFPQVNPTADNKRFTCWKNGENVVTDGSTFLAVNADYVVMAQFVDTYSVSFYDGTTLLSTQDDLIEGEAFTLPTPAIKTGYQFSGWYAGETQYSAQAANLVLPTNADLTINAIYEANTCVRIVFNFGTADLEFDYTIPVFFNVPSGVTLAQLFDTSEYVYPSSEIEVNGWEFVGWSLTSGGLVNYTEDTKLVIPTDGMVFTLYAIWDSSSYN